MTIRQRLLEGVMVGVVGGLVATAIGGVGVLVYNEMVESRDQLKETTKVTKQLNETSITSIDRLSVIDESIASLIRRVNQLEVENEVLLKANRSNGEAIKLVTEALGRATFSDHAESSTKIKQAGDVNIETSKILKSLTQTQVEKDKLRTEQQERQLKLDDYRDTQSKQLIQQQEFQQKW